MNAIPAEYYYIVYLFVMTMLTWSVLASKHFEVNLSAKAKAISEKKAIILTAFMILFIGFRPISYVFGDMPSYAYAMTNHKFEYVETTFSGNYVFTNLMTFLSSHGAGEQVPIVLLAVINFIAAFFAFKKLFPQNFYFSMLVFFSAFATYGGAVNGLKAGCAYSLFMVALAYRENWKICALFLFLSFGFHHSMELPIIAFVVCLFIKKTKYYYILWMICLILAAAHVTYFQTFFSDFVDEKNAGYLITDEDSFVKGFRPDFILYSAIPLIVGYYAVFKKKIQSESYKFLLHLYILINSMWMLVMYASFTNRIAGLSWGMYPVVLIYPFLKEKWGNKQYKYASYCLLGQLAFIWLFVKIG